MAERGTYRSIPHALLSGKDFRQLPERARWVFVVLKLNIGLTGIATWYPDELLARVTSESGASAEDVAYALDLLEEHGWIEREDNVVWVKGQLEHDPHLSSSNSKHRSSVQQHVAGLPRIGIVLRFCSEHRDWIPMEEAIAMGIDWVLDGNLGATTNRNRKTKRIPKAKANQDGPGLRSESRYAFMGEMRGVWLEAYGGAIPAGSPKRLEPLVKLHGVDEVARRFRIYTSSTQAAYASVPRFVSTFGAWGQPSGSGSDSRILGVGGVPTAEELESAGIRIR